MIYIYFYIIHVYTDQIVSRVQVQSELIHDAVSEPCIKQYRLILINATSGLTPYEKEYSEREKSDDKSWPEISADPHCLVQLRNIKTHQLKQLLNVHI